MKTVKDFKSFNESKNEEIFFGEDLDTVIKQLLTLNNRENFKVSRLSDDKVKIIYDGGYNGVYEHECVVEVKFYKKIVDWNYWKFIITSDIHNDSFETEQLSGSPSGDFLDFFIDMYIRDIGNIINMDKDLI